MDAKNVENVLYDICSTMCNNIKISSKNDVINSIGEIKDPLMSKLHKVSFCIVEATMWNNCDTFNFDEIISQFDTVILKAIIPVISKMRAFEKIDDTFDGLKHRVMYCLFLKGKNEFVDDIVLWICTRLTSPTGIITIERRSRLYEMLVKIMDNKYMPTQEMMNKICDYPCTEVIKLLMTYGVTLDIPQYKKLLEERIAIDTLGIPVESLQNAVSELMIEKVRSILNDYNGCLGSPKNIVERMMKKLKFRRF